MEEKKTLVILSPGFAADENDSSCLPAQQAMIRAINKLYPTLTIIIIAFQYPYTKIAYQWFNNEVIPFHGSNKRVPKSRYSWIHVWQKSNRLILWMRIWAKLTRLKKQNTIIGILSFWVGECAVIGHHFGKAKGIPHYTWILGQDAKSGNRYMRMARIKGHSLVAMSDFLSNTFYSNYGIRPLHVIPNAIDTSLFAISAVERDIDIIGVGSLIPLKRFDLFISIVQKIIIECPKLKVLICGTGPERNALEQMIHKNQLENIIQLTGEIKHEKVLALLQRSKIMLHTSSYEGFSGACLEALYAGAHVISFTNPQNGWIRQWHITTDIDQMINTTIQLLKSENTTYQSTIPYKMEDTAKAFIQLFSK